MGNNLVWETSLVADALSSIETLLPDAWHLESTVVSDMADKSVDGLISLIAPSGEQVDFLVEGKRSGTSSTLILAQLRELSWASDLPLLFVSDYIGPGLRERLSSEGISYADATGWVSISLNAPLGLLTGQRAERSPRGDRPTAVARLNGVVVNRITRVSVQASPDTGQGRHC